MDLRDPERNRLFQFLPTALRSWLPFSAQDAGIVLFDGDSGKLLKRALGTAAAGSWPKVPVGTVMTTPEPGAWEFDGVAHYDTIDTTSGRGQRIAYYRQKLDADITALSAIGNFFGTNSNLPLVANAYYEIEIEAFFLKSTAGTVTWTFTNTAAPTQMNLIYTITPVGGIVSTAAATMLDGQQRNLTTTAPTIVTASLTTATNHYHYIKIQLRNGTGTSLKFQVTPSAGSITPQAGSRWRAHRLAAGNAGVGAA